MTNEATKKLLQGVKLPVIMAPMFLISNPKMVLEACGSGIIGTFPALNARTTEQLDDWMQEITDGLQQLKEENGEETAPWGINFISHRSNKRFTEDLALIEKYQPPLVITSLGDPSPVVAIVKEYGGVVLSDVIDMKFAKKALEKGSDGLVLVAAGAGGHGGRLNPIAFMHEIRENFDGPIALAGTLSKGEDILVAETLGADLAYFGTKFIVAEESSAVDEYRKLVIDSSISDITYTPAFSGIHANYLTKSIVNAGLDPEQLPEKGKIDFSELGNPDVKAWRDVWGAGQGVGPIKKELTVKEITNELREEYLKAKEKIANEYHETVQRMK
ncbi:nitronate monooxygenase family protein [Oceanobacillus sp. AG]|uniref:NAD(P)H-dependent flavin oxidoreductase n=1 Tax=Oceanobacillus sp. AG TaxID=2681969 RepID=UPI0012EBA333|nr:nitronate monooxygenase family protein [Oceanobacillus sp. AG]